MSNATLTHPSPNLSEPQDPWNHTADTQAHPDLAALPYMSRDQEAAQFNGIIENFALDQNQNTVVHATLPDQTSAPDAEIGAVPTDVKPAHTPRHRWTPERDYTPTPAADIERRRRMNLQASFALAHTLRNSNPELMRNLVQTTTEPVTEVIAERPANYRGTRRRLGRLARLFSR